MQTLIDSDAVRADALQDVLAANGHGCVVVNCVDGSNCTLLQASTVIMVQQDSLTDLRAVVSSAQQASQWDARKVLLVLQPPGTSRTAGAETGLQDIAWLVAGLCATPEVPAALIAVLDLLARQPQLAEEPVVTAVENSPDDPQQARFHQSGADRAASESVAR